MPQLLKHDTKLVKLLRTTSNYAAKNDSTDSFYSPPLWFAKKILNDLHLSWREAALVGVVPRVRKRLQKSAGFGYLLSEGSYGRFVCASGIVTHGPRAESATSLATLPFSFLYFQCVKPIIRIISQPSFGMLYLCVDKKSRDLRDNFRARERQLSSRIQTVREKYKFLKERNKNGY